MPLTARKRWFVLVGSVVLAGCGAGSGQAVDGAPVDDASRPTADGAPPAVDGAPPPVDAAPHDAPPDALAGPSDPTLPRIHDHSGAPPERVLALVRAAVDGLGFDPASGQGPNPSDRIFVGRHYLAWIDETGFYGKLNGLWTLNAAAGAALDFVLKDPDGRPINLFVPGENGDGAWPSSYKGAEHLEFPNRTPEPNDSPSCASGDWCNQYGMNEAVPYTNPRIPWWSACNRGAAGWSDRHNAISVDETADRLTLVYEAPLVKEADGDGTNDGDDCHRDYLFADGVRRSVYVRAGYELYADADHFDRTLQFVNPAGNPPFDGPMSLIGGFVMTQWPSPHYLKRFNRFWKPASADVNMDWNGPVVLRAGAWNDLSAKPPIDRDVLIAWIDQPITLSAAAGDAVGASATLAHVGPSDNRDVGACLCTVHGGLEMGGGMLHGGDSLPIDGGHSSIVARRRLTVPSVGAPPSVRAVVYEAESMLSHGPGRVDGDGWSANTAADAPGHMVYGPYATDWGTGSAQAVFHLQVDNVTAANDLVVTLDVFDATSQVILASRQVHRHDLRAPGAYQRFRLDFPLDGRAGHAFETRIYWHDTSYVKVDKVVVNLAAGG